MSDERTKWRTYEEVAQHLLNEFATHFGLGRVEEKQLVPGVSGTEWEIDAKGVVANGEGFVIVECRRHTKSKLSQESTAGLAYRIIDTGASGGVLVTSLDLQAGAKKVANHSEIHHVILNPESTTTDYVLRFLNNTFIGVGDTCNILLKETLTIEAFQDGKLIEKRHYD